LRLHQIGFFGQFLKVLLLSPGKISWRVTEMVLFNSPYSWIHIRIKTVGQCDGTKKQTSYCWI